MGEKKVTTMVLKVDLQCCKCYKKVKKVLCKFPQIQDQEYDEKNNKVIIKVVCCNPEKIRDKLCCKGDGAIKSIEILEPKPKPPPASETPKPPPANATPKPPPASETPKPPPASATPKPPPANATPKPPERKPQKPPPEPENSSKPDAPKGNPPKPSTPLPGPPPVVPAPVPCYPVVPAPCYPPFPYPVRDCCLDCYEGRGGGPCGRPVCESWGGRHIRYYEGYCGRPVNDSWGSCGGYGVYRSRCTDYICEENPNAACTIM